VDHRSIIRSLGLVTLGKILGQIVSWSATILVMRWLTPADYGLSATVFALLALLTAPTEYVLINQLVRHSRNIQSTLRSYEGFAVTLSGFSILILLLAGQYYAHIPGKEALQTGMLLIALSLVLLPLRIGPEAQILREMRYGEQIRVTLTASLIGASATLLGALAGAGFLALLIGPIAREAALCVGYRRCTRTPFRPLLTLARLRLVLDRSRRLMLTEFLVHAGGAIPILIYAQFITVTEMGYFTTASYWALVPLSKVMNIVNQVALPAFSKENHRTGTLSSMQIVLPVKLMLIASILLYSLLGLLAAPFVLLVLGEQWLPMAALLQIFCLSMPLRAIRSFLVSPLQAAKRDAALLRMQIVQVSATCFGALMAIQVSFEWLTPIHVAFSMAGASIAIVIALRALHTPLHEVLLPLSRGTLIAGVALLLTITSQAMLQSQPALISAGVQTVFFLIVCGTGLFLFEPMIRTIAHRRWRSCGSATDSSRRP